MHMVYGFHIFFSSGIILWYLLVSTLRQWHATKLSYYSSIYSNANEIGFPLCYIVLYCIWIQAFDSLHSGINIVYDQSKYLHKMKYSDKCIVFK